MTVSLSKLSANPLRRVSFLIIMLDCIVMFSVFFISVRGNKNN